MFTLILIFAVSFSITIFRSSINLKETGYDNNFNEI